MDKNYWKNAYSNTWKESSERELYLARWIKENTGFDVETVGLGAGTSDYISGSARENGYEKGSADLHVTGTNIYIEVTGPLSTKVPVDTPLWFRPDKILSAIKKMQRGQVIIFAHHCPSEDLWRIINIDENLAQRFRNYKLPVVNPIIRGRKERYIEISCDDECIQNLNYLKNFIKNNY